MIRTYHSLMVREMGGDWFPDFGDYDRETVKQEMRDRKESGDCQHGTRFKIVSHFDNQDARAIASRMMPFE